MKKITFLLLFAISLATCTVKSNPSAERQLFQMLDKKKLFQLETLLEEKRPELPQGIVLYLEAHLQNAFNQTEQSLQTIDILLGNYGKLLNDTLLYNIFVIKYDNLHKQSRYREAVESLKIAINKYGHAVDSIELTNLQEETYNTIEPLTGLPPQKIYIATDVTIPVSLNQYNHIIMSVTNGEQSENFVFDTGASNVVSESSAQRLGIRVLKSSASSVGAADKKVQFKVGFADRLWLGDLMLENVVFMVMPDEFLSFPEADYVIHGIIGFPVINQMKEIVIHKNESITVVAHPTKRNLHNLFLDRTMPVVLFESNRDTLFFIMDTGATASKFSENYFTANSVEIRENATPKTIRRGGVGGFVDSEVYELENVQLKIGGRELTIPTLMVLTGKLSYLKNYDGHLGQDVLMHFNKLILNYEDMYLTFED